MRRVAIVGWTAAFVAVLSAAGAVGVSSAASASPGTVTCGKITGTTSAMTIKKCTPKNKADKTLSGVGTALASGGSLTWAPSGGKLTIARPTIGGTTPAWGTCKVNTKTQSQVTEIKASGRVLSDTSGYAAPGSTFKASVCLNSQTGKLSLAPGTTATF